MEYLKKYLSLKYLLKILIIAVIYFLAAKLGLSMSTQIKQVTLVWPATGISVAALLIFGLDLWPGVLIGAFVSDFTNMQSFYSALGTSSANAIEAGLAVYFLRKYKFDLAFSRIKDVLMYIVIGCVLNTMIAAAIGTVSLISGGIDSWSNFFKIFGNWWVGDFLGAIIVGPVILAWAKFYKFRLTALQAIEGILLIALTFLGSLAILTGAFPFIPFSFQYQVKYLIVPFLIWATYRFGMKGSTFLVLIIASIAIWGATRGTGPFITQDPEATLLYLGIFTSVISFTFMIFSVIIEQRNKAEREVLASEKRFRSLIENSADAIVSVTSTGRITYASPSVKTMLGYEPKELVGSDGFKIIYAEDIKISKQKLGELLKNPGQTMYLQNRLIFKDGRVHWMDAVGINLITDPAVHGIIINFRDINDRVELERVKGEFVSLSAHQMRAPLSIVRWYTETILKAKNLPKNIKGYVDEVYLATLKMNDTVNLLLDVSRFELGTVKVTSEPVNLGSIILDVIRERDPDAKPKKLKITYDDASKIPQILGDSKLIRIIIENLVNNAIKYSHQGGKIAIHTVTQKDKILFSVTDNGIGIPVEDQPKIFTKLFRGSNVKSADTVGLGLGLYLTKLIANLKGGNVWFKSKEGEGSTFFVEFPKKVKINQ